MLSSRNKRLASQLTCPLLAVNVSIGCSSPPNCNFKIGLGHVFFSAGETNYSPPQPQFFLRPLFQTSRLVVRQFKNRHARPFSSRQARQGTTESLARRHQGIARIAEGLRCRHHRRFRYRRRRMCALEFARSAAGRHICLGGLRQGLGHRLHKTA